MKNQYFVASLDVIGNSKAGFEVNDSYRTSCTLELSENAETKEILKALKRSGYILSYNGLTVDKSYSCENDIYIVEKRTNRPFCTLMLETNV